MTLVTADLASILVAALASWALYAVFCVMVIGETVAEVVATFKLAGVVSLVFVPSIVLIVYSSVRDHYTRPKPFWTEARDVLVGMGHAIVVSSLVMYFAVEHFSRLWCVSSWVLLGLVLPLTRRAARRSLIRYGSWFRPAVIVASPESADAIRDVIESDVHTGLKVVGLLSLEGEPCLKAECPDDAPSDHFACLNDLEERYGRLEIVCAPSAMAHVAVMSEIADEWLPRTNNLMVAPQATGLPLYGAQAIGVFSHDTVLLSLQNNLGKAWARIVKRAFDLVVSSLLVLVLSSLLVVISVLVARDGGPIIYRSRRVGQRGESFDCWKFRSMGVDAEASLARHLAADPLAQAEWQTYFKLANDPRITRIGRFVRRTSLDELPQLFNVLRGEMSLVGPRPILPEEQASYGSDFKLYSMTRPGITGMWQVCGRSALAQTERARLNTWYARNWSLWIDVVILLKTVPVAVHGGGAS